MASVEGYSLELPVVERARSEQADLAALVGTYSGLLFRIAHSVLRSRHEAEEVVQDTFVRVLEHRRELPGVRDVRVWLIRIAWNLALDRRRKIRPEQLDGVFAESLAARNVPADRALHDAQRMKVVLAEMERLPKAEKHVLLLSAVEEMGTSEMAEVLGKSESAVRALLFRARTRLRERLEKGGRG
ncbi:RNA polymerase sigma factor [Granulicella tundricola]|uniref:RNA polymerase, sigma-24 subunit, ECF subfamily n=1 Tax=Granulicella tundricola (strain ATCC BAA-1859 / DSM 23138 / MP5ACTX9) TaxID=1198114 RepID=E8WX80_GRATM|nr:sigma-70 family RNA polymerase sigma factor [Granulicella tundricola]ADW69722.1 RNA polymerase, sigma-24 subunit, ECF subfamily [Granulicella tundricola MP5ACTX9]